MDDTITLAKSVKQPSHKDRLREKLLQDPDYANNLLAAAIEEFNQDNDIDAFYQALRILTICSGGVTQLAENTGLNRQNLHRILNGDQDPRMQNIMQLAKQTGYKFQLVPV